MIGYFDFLDSLKKYQLLAPSQFESFSEEAQSDQHDVHSMAEMLRQRGWLTDLQVHSLLNGQASELVVDNRYVLMSVIGEGGMGKVYKVRHQMLDAVRALKVIRGEYGVNEKAIMRFMREMRVVSSLHHPNIVQGYDAGRDGELIYFVMEFVPGKDLAEVIQEQGPLPISRATDYIRQSALGLQHAHENGLVHRDIKPSNLLLTNENNVVKILDLGLARLEKPGLAQDAAAPLTLPESVMGTPDFMAPEQGRDASNVDIRADVYSLGCSLYQMLTGQVPFPGNDLVGKLIKHRSEDPAPVTQFRQDVPQELISVLKQMMAKPPEHRFQTPGEVAVALEQFCKAQQNVPVAFAGPPTTELEPGNIAKNREQTNPPTTTGLGDKSGYDASITPNVVTLPPDQQTKSESSLPFRPPSASASEAFPRTRTLNDPLGKVQDERPDVEIPVAVPAKPQEPEPKKVPLVGLLLLALMLVGMGWGGYVLFSGTPTADSGSNQNPQIAGSTKENGNGKVKQPDPPKKPSGFVSVEPATLGKWEGTEQYYDTLVLWLDKEKNLKLVFKLIPGNQEEPLLRPFYILETEVSVEQFEHVAQTEEYKKTVTQWLGALKEKEKKGDRDAVDFFRDFYQQWNQFKGWDKDKTLPVRMVTVIEAHSFAEALTKRLGSPEWEISLPNKLQWDKAAGVYDRDRYPDPKQFHPKGPFVPGYEIRNPFVWDNKEVVAGGLNAPKDVAIGPIPVGTSTRDRSFYGIRDMSGNVKEWTRTFNIDSGSLDFPLKDPLPFVGMVTRGESWLSIEPWVFPDKDVPPALVKSTGEEYLRSDRGLGFRVIMKIPVK